MGRRVSEGGFKRGYRKRNVRRRGVRTRLKQVGAAQTASLFIIPGRGSFRHGSCGDRVFVYWGILRVHWFKWATFSLLGAVAAAASAQSRLPAPPAPELIISPQLRPHEVQESDMPVFSVADDVRTDEDGKLILTGKAEVRRIDSVVKGDRIDYQRDTGQVDVQGSGLIMRDGTIVNSSSFSYNMDGETGEITAPTFILGEGGGSGRAEFGEIFSRDHMRLTEAFYVACPCPEPAWHITSPRVDFYIDKNEGVARNGVLFFKGVPILASPYLSFPLRKERKSGFLLPTYGGSSNSGLELSVPYYFNLAPNYDLTLTPRFMAKRGVQLGTEFRYLGSDYEGQLTGTYLNKDRRADTDRWMYRWQHNHNLGNGFYSAIDLHRVSDDDYYRDFTSLGLNEASIDSIPSMATLGWSGSKYWQAHVQTLTYQTLQDRTAQYSRLPQYDKLPELYVRGARYNWGGFDLTSDNYATQFKMPKYRDPFHPYPYNPSLFPRQSYDGQRVSSYNSIAYPIIRAGWYMVPKAAMHLSQYHTDWHGFALGADGYNGRLPGTPRTQSRALPLLSLDTGMTFERPTSLFGNAAIQTLEPRLYYLYVPYRDQASIPIYDTSIASFNFAQAFEENLFSGGWDRIANANQLTLGLTSRWLDESTGAERLSLSVAQRLYFENQKVTMPGAKPRTSTKSDYLLGVNAALTDKLDLRFDAQVNPESRERNRMSAGVRWQPKRLALLALNYRYERDPAQLVDPSVVNAINYIDNSKEQMSLSGQWPLSSKIFAVGRVDYSLQEKRSTQLVLGFEYKGDCCWVARTVYQRYAVSEQTTNTAVFFQLELLGLGSLGTDPLGMLSKAINGYQSVTPPIPETTTYERYE
ncbi:LPS-assembly protein LptD [Pusillimonas sp. CC-YST705]|uniref:LPS-assembly protein LptD n=1 Tax=Mesopusillimonas faecipullorum TaxID=2755040 RepID=A0ABS8C902_9BURK|nr:LPS-assembly protein LptD [Mesopusillimonas faecipullorum]